MKKFYFSALLFLFTLTTAQGSYITKGGAGVDCTTGTSGQVYTTDGAACSFTTASGTGTVVGPASSTARSLSTWNGTGGINLYDNPNSTLDSSANLWVGGTFKSGTSVSEKFAFNNEQATIKSLNASTSGANASIVGWTLENSNTAGSASKVGLAGIYDRAITSNTTDTATPVGIQAYGGRFSATGSTYTNASSQGVSGLFVFPFILSTGTMAITNYSALNVGADSAVTGTNKYALRTGNMTGATNNYQLNLGTGLSKFNDTTDSSSTSTGSIVTLGGIGLAKNLFVGGSTTLNTGTGLLHSSSGGAITSSPVALASDVSGTLPVANGGTGVTSVPTTPAASVFAAWDANSNFTANAFIFGYATTATAAGTTTLTVASKQTQFFTGSTTQTVVLPVTSTLVLGQQFLIVNRSSGVVTVQSSGANSIQAMAANTQLTATVILTSGTTAASWDAVYASNALAAGGSSPLTTKGDLYGHSTVDVRIPVGSDGFALVGRSDLAAGVGYGSDSGSRTRFGLSGTASGATFAYDPGGTTPTYGSGASEYSLSANGSGKQVELVNLTSGLNFYFGGTTKAAVTQDGTYNSFATAGSSVFIWGGNTNEMRARKTVNTSSTTATTILSVDYGVCTENVITYTCTTQARNSTTPSVANMASFIQAFHFTQRSGTVTTAQTDAISTFNPASIIATPPASSISGTSIVFKVTAPNSDTWRWNMTCTSYASDCDL